MDTITGRKWRHGRILATLHLLLDLKKLILMTGGCSLGRRGPWVPCPLSKQTPLRFSSPAQTLPSSGPSVRPPPPPPPSAFSKLPPGVHGRVWNCPLYFVKLHLLCHFSKCSSIKFFLFPWSWWVRRKRDQFFQGLEWEVIYPIYESSERSLERSVGGVRWEESMWRSSHFSLHIFLCCCIFLQWSCIPFLLV